MKIANNNKKITLLLILLAALLPLLVSDQYIVRLMTIAGIYVILAVSLNFVTGYAGQFCLGWAAFYGIGAYTSALIVTKLGLSFWLAFPLAGIVAALFGIILAIPTMRLRDIYLALTTLGFGEIVRLVLLNWTDLTRGSMGIPGIPSPVLFGQSLDSPFFYYYFILSMVLFIIGAMGRMIDSRMGRALIAIRENEIAAKSMGINTTAYKIQAFAIAAFFSGLAGSFYAHYSSYIDPNAFGFGESIAILAMVVLGGMGSTAGAVFGAVMLSLLPEVLRGLAEYRMIIFGGILMIVMLVRPQGFFGNSGDGRRKIRKSVGEVRSDGAIRNN
jgi:branched-chain amino acid transport system permease protein